jgi:hypothetical protein
MEHAGQSGFRRGYTGPIPRVEKIIGRLGRTPRRSQSGQVYLGAVAQRNLLVVRRPARLDFSFS